VSWLVALLASVLLLFGSGLLLSTLGRRRGRRGRPLPPSRRLVLEGVVGVGLAEIVAGAVALRHDIQLVAQRGREMLAVERHLGRSPRRPLWRQIEDANFGHQLEGLRRAAAAWLTSVDGLRGADQQLFETLGLDVEAVRALADVEGEGWRDADAGRTMRRDRNDELHAVQTQLDQASACLRRIEREISGYRGGGYR